MKVRYFKIAVILNDGTIHTAVAHKVSGAQSTFTDVVRAIEANFDVDDVKEVRVVRHVAEKAKVH